MRRMSMGLRSLIATLLFLTSALAKADVVTIEEITTRGEGCPTNSGAITIAPDLRSFSVLFDQAFVQTSENSHKDYKICELTIKNRVPAGLHFNFHSLDFRGFAQVDTGSSALQRTSYYRLSSKGKWKLFRRVTNQFSANSGDSFLIEQDSQSRQTPQDQLVDHTEIIKVQIQLYAKSSYSTGAEALLALDSIDGSVTGIKNTCLQK